MAVAVAAALICPILIPADPYMTDKAAAAGTTGGALYGYVMSSPVAAAADGSILYLLTADGSIVAFGDSTETVGNAEGASKIAVSGGQYVTDERGGLGVFAGNYTGEITSDAIYVNGEVFVSSESGAEFVGGALSGNTLYVAERTADADGECTDIYAYDLRNSSTRTLTEHEIAVENEADGSQSDITAMTVTSGGEIYYSTPYSLYVAGRSHGYDVGGITSLTYGENGLYYTTRSGKLCLFEDGRGETVLCASGRISVAARRDFAAIADYGNNRLTVVRGGVSSSTETERPGGVAIGYDGTIYAATENTIVAYTDALAISETVAEFDGSEHIEEIGIDPSDITDPTIYAVTDGGVLRRTSDDRTLTGVAHVDVSVNGDVYVMTADGSVTRYDENLENGETVCSAGEYNDLAVDYAGNVFRAAENGIYKNDALVYEKSGVTEIAVSMASADGVGFGDIISVSRYDCATETIARSTVGTDMNDDETDADYAAFMEEVASPTPVAENENPDIRKASVTAGIYGVPAEKPDSAISVGVGTNVIVVKKYEGTDYLYVIAEATGGSVTGFVNERALSASLPLEDLYGDTDVCAPVSLSDVYKYPSLASPKIGTAQVGSAYGLLDFVSGYKDCMGRTWVRISFPYDGGYVNGYVLRGNVAIDGTTGGEYKQIVPDAVIKADEDTVLTYYAPDGESVLGTIANGTPVQLEEEFMKGNEFTKITFVSNTDTGATTTCYVRTEYLKQTEAGWYQVIMFIVGAVVVAAIIIIIVVRVRKKKKID